MSEPTLPPPQEPYPLLPAAFAWKLHLIQFGLDVGLIAHDEAMAIILGAERTDPNRDTSGMGSDCKGESRKV